MSTAEDRFAWTRKLECPPAVCNETTKKILCKSFIEFLWDNLSNATFSASEVTEARKNILLYKLRHKEKDSAIETVRKLAQLKLESSKQEAQIQKLEEEYEEQDYLVREKAQQQKKLTSDYSVIKAKKDLLTIKYEQTSVQLNDCANMRSVCQHLMPNTDQNLTDEQVKNSLNAVANLCSGMNKEQVWERISSTLGKIETLTLWNHLYHTLSQDVDTLVKLDPLTPSNNSAVIGKNIDIGIAGACGLHVHMVAKRLLYDTKVNMYQQNIMGFLQKIEEMATDCTDIDEWLVLTLEVQKLEVEQKCLQDEVDAIKEYIDSNSILRTTVAQISSDIQDIDTEIETYVQNIQQALVYLKSASTHILRIKEKIRHELHTVAAMRSTKHDKWLNSDLTTELDIFQDILDLRALRKIMLKGEVGIYRHTKCCFNEASISIPRQLYTQIMPYFPTVQTPIYSLVECYKNWALNSAYKKVEISLPESLESVISPLSSIPEHSNSDILDLLNSANTVSEKTWNEIHEFNAILNSWTNQTVQEALALCEETVDGVSFTEWLRRYSLLLRMIQNSKQQTNTFAFM